MYPLLIGYGLSSSEELLLKYLLRHHPLEVSSMDSLLAVATQRDHKLFYIPVENTTLLQEAFAWSIPVLTLIGQSAPDLVQSDPAEATRIGISAVWHFNSASSDHLPLLFPDPKLPRRRGHFYLCTDEMLFQKFVRSMLPWAGYESRIDFNSARDLLEILNGALESRDPAMRPELILMDLDSDKMDVMEFFYGLRTTFKKFPQLRNSIRIMVIKDFANPGLDINLIASSLKPYVRRIFHPVEAVLVLLETLIFHDLMIDESQRLKNERMLNSFEQKLADKHLSSEQRSIRPVVYRSIDRILYGGAADLPAESPFAYLEFIKREFMLRRCQTPFLWIYEHLSSLTQNGLLIRPDP